MWLRAITPSKGVMVRQHIMQLFSVAGQWASLIEASELLVVSSSVMHNSIQATYEPGSQPPLEIPMKDLAIWLGKYAGVTYTHVACLEEYTTCALTKMAHSNALLDINCQWISDKSVLLCLPLLYLFHPQVCPISIASLTPLCLSLFPFFILHPCTTCFIDICSHVIMILSSLTYSLLTPFLSFLISH